MPIFEYVCNDCHTPFERIVPRHDSKTTCVKCGSKKIEKQLSVFAVAGGSSSDMGGFCGPMEGAGGGACGPCGAPSPGMCGLPD